MDFAELPLFPLHTVLFPGGWLPLQIFEVRYLDLMKRCERSGEPFGVVSLQSGHEVRRAPTPQGTQASDTFATVGTLAQLVQVAHPQAGLMVVVAQGLQRFTLQHTRELPHGLWVGEASLLPDDAPTPLPDDLADLGVRLRSVMKAMAAGEGDSLTTLPAPDAACWQDAGWVANRWAERLPMPALERQRLMSLDNPLWRLELVAEWLEQVIKTHGTGQARG